MFQTKPKKLLCIALVLILIGSLGAWLLQTGFNTVEIRDIYLVTDGEQYLHALAYIPKSASAENPCPAVIVSHGWTDSAESQDLASIELARRGVAVLAMDGYSHGMSSNAPECIIVSTFVDGLGMVSLVDYANSGIMDFIDTSRIGLMGHSMGGSCIGGTLAYYGNQYAEAYAAAQSPDSDGGEEVTAAEQAYCDSLYPIDSVLVVGNMDETVTQAFDTLRCNFGVLFGTREELTVEEQEALASGPQKEGFQHFGYALQLLQTIDTDAADVDPNTYYGSTENNTLRVFYETFATHPTTTMLPNAGALAMEYWTKVFSLTTELSPKNQVHLFKQLFNLVALVGLLMFVFPAGELLLSVPCFAGLRGTAAPKRPAIVGKRKKAFLLGLLINTVVSIGVGLFVNWFYTTPLYAELFPIGMISDTRFFSATTVTVMSLFSLLNAIWLLVFFLYSYRKDKKTGVCGAESLGLRISARDFFKTLGLAAAILGFVYGIVWFAKWLFNTDFRFWVVAFKIFNPGKLWTFLVYLPVFFLFYFVVSLMVNGPMRTEGISERKSTGIAAASLAFTPVLFVLLQYICLLTTGNLFFFGNWGPVFYMGMCIWQLALAPYYLRHFYDLTGKNWLGSVLVSSLYCLCVVANTSISNSWF